MLKESCAMPDPIKRHIGLQPISREHHDSLLLAWKIRTGLELGIDINRIVEYVEWFWTVHLLPHMAFEEAHVYPILDAEDPELLKALEQHGTLRSLFEQTPKNKESLLLLQEELVKHIRYEERVLFKLVEQKATETQLNQIKEAHVELDAEEWLDEYWVRSS